jgi:valyl-tRNA synthetase
MNIEGVDDKQINMTALTPADKWILHRLNETAKEANENIKNYRLGEVAHILYDFFWNSYCDWYVEIAKAQLQGAEKANTQRVLRYVLERTLRLLHPIMPHITEKIWQIIPGEAYKDGQMALMKCDYPVFDTKFENKESENQMEFVFESIKAIRNIRQSLNIAPSTAINTEFFATEQDTALLEKTQSYIKKLARVDEIKLLKEKTVPEQSATAVIGNTTLFVPLAGLIDIHTEIQKQKKKSEKLAQEKNSLTGRLNNEKF